MSPATYKSFPYRLNILKLKNAKGFFITSSYILGKGNCSISHAKPGVLGSSAVVAKLLSFCHMKHRNFKDRSF